MKAYHQGQLDFFCGIYALINGLRSLCGIDLSESRRILAESLKAVSAYPLLWQALLENETDFYWLMHYLLGRFSHASGFTFKAARLPVVPLQPAERKQLKASMPSENKNRSDQGDQGDWGEMRGLYGLTDSELCAWLDLDWPKELDLGELGLQDLYVRLPQNSTPAARECSWTLNELWPLLQSWLPAKSLFSGFTRDSGRRRCLLLRFHRYLYVGQPPVISHWTCGLEFIRDTLLLFDCTADKEAVHSLPMKECVLRESELAPERLLRLEPDSLFFIEKT